MMEGLVSLAATIAWPAVAAWLVGHKYKPEISQLLARFKGGQLGPHRIELATEQQQPVPASITDDTPEKPALLQAPSVADPQVKLILNNLQRDYGNDANGKIEFLIKWLLSINTERQHETRYRLIFGSQISALEYLNTMISLQVSQLHSYYEIARASLAQNNFPLTFEAWLNFLVGSELVTAENGVVTITPQGRDFLTYLAKNGIPKNKPH